MTKNMIFISILIAFGAFMIASRSQADERVCDTENTWAEAQAASTYKHIYEVVLDTLEGTEDSGLFCWIGNIDLDIAMETHIEEGEGNFFTAIPLACDIFVESDDDVTTLNCIQDVTMPGGEKVVVHRTNVLF
jgi:hypothetical protein